jgi:hypothetical protein
MMKSSKAPSITNIIGVILVIVAIVSAGGLYYVASEYTQISDTLVSVEAAISDVAILHDNHSGEYQITLTIFINNSSPLAIDIYSIEYSINADKTPNNLMMDDTKLFSRSTGLSNGTVPADSSKVLQDSYIINSTSITGQKLEDAIDGGNTTMLVVNGFVLYNISDFPNVKSSYSVGIYPPIWVVIKDA